MELGKILGTILTKYGEGQQHQENVRLKGADYRTQALLDQIRAGSAAAEERRKTETYDLARRREAGMIAAIKKLNPALAGLPDDLVLQYHEAQMAQAEFARKERDTASQEAARAAQAASDLHNAEKPFDAPIGATDRQAVTDENIAQAALARSQAANVGRIQPRQPLFPEEVAKLNAETQAALGRAANQYSLAGVMPPGAGVLAPPPAAQAACPEGKTGNKGTVICRGGQWVTQR